MVCGGVAENHPLYVSTLADVLGLPVYRMATDEPVLLGAAVLAASAAGVYEDVSTAARALCRVAPDAAVLPDERVAAFHDAKYAVYLDLQTTADRWRDTMAPFGGGADS